MTMLLVFLCLLVSPSHAARVYALGDISWCNAGALPHPSVSTVKSGPDGRIADLIAADSTARVLALGDMVYLSGTSSEYQNCYAHTIGRHVARTHAVAGNHDYYTPGAAPFYSFFASSPAPRATPAQPWYTFELDQWRIIALDSNVAYSAGGLQLRPSVPSLDTPITDTVWNQQRAWLQSLLRNPTKPCTLAFFHHPLVSSGSNGPQPQNRVRELWADLYDGGVDVALVGHDHLYERYGLLNRDGSGVDAARGVRQFVVGSGGGLATGITSLKAHSEFRVSKDSHPADPYGALRLDLNDGVYSWQFVSASGAIFDSGTTQCHTSNPVSVPGPPTILVSSIGTTLTINWLRPTTGGVATSYNIHYGPNVYRGFSSPFVVDVPVGDYSLSLSASNGAGTGPVGATVVHSVRPLPPPPGSLSYTYNGATVSIKWGVGIGATSYALDVGTAPGASNILSQDVGNTQSLQATVSFGTTTLYLRVRSMNGGFSSAPSVELPMVLNGGSVSSAVRSGSLQPPNLGDALQTSVFRVVKSANTQSSFEGMLAGAILGGLVVAAAGVTVGVLLYRRHLREIAADPAPYKSF